jgi:hypothetical protein
VIVLVAAATITGFMVFSGGKSKTGKVIVTEQNFAIRKLSSHSYTIDTTGKAKNVGDSDLKNVIVTGKCSSCAVGMSPNHWTVVDEEESERSNIVIPHLPTY